MVTYSDGVGEHRYPARCSTSTASTAGSRRSRPCSRPPASAAWSSTAIRSSEFAEKVRQHETWINGGFFVFEPGVLDYLDGDAEPLEQAPLTRLARDGELFAYKHTGFWHPMDTVRDRDHLQALCEGGRPWLDFSKRPKRPWSRLAPCWSRMRTTPRRSCSGKRVLVTGHTGFKGGWLSVWLRAAGRGGGRLSLPPLPGAQLLPATGLPS